MSRPIQKVVLAGASGLLGKPMLSALLDAHFEVTALTREDSSATFPSGVRVVPVDYDSVTSLTEALRGQDALISVVGSKAISNQTKQVDAAIAAGVARVIPSEFGCDISLEKVAALPMFDEKVAIEKYCEEKCRGTGTTYTFVYTNAFLDWALDFGFLLDLKKQKIDLFDGGDIRISATPLEFIARGTASILKHPEETANRSVRMQGVVTTQQQLLEIAQKFTGANGWEINQVSSAEVEKKAFETLEKEPANFMSWALGMITRAHFGEGFSRNFTDRNDNELLGLEELSMEEVEGYVRHAIPAN